MRIALTGVNVSGTDYTWQQTWRFLIIGLVWTFFGSLPPVLWTLYHNYVTYSDPIDWALIRGMVLAATGPSLAAYWLQHKALLKMPPWFIIPPEFHPAIKQTITEEHGPHSTEITSTGDGTVTEKTSPHETKITAETVVDIKPNAMKGD